MRTVIVVVLGIALLRALERFFPPRDPAGLPRRTRLFGRERLTDVAHIAFNQIVTKQAIKVVALGVLIAFVIVFRLPHDPASITEVWHREARLAGLPLVIQTPLALLFADLVGYWVHRAFHHGTLWRFHAVHHSSRVLDWLAGARNHPVVELLTTVIILSSLLAIGLDPRVLAVTAPLGFYAILLHANVRWGRSFMRYVIVTPLVHRWHHAHPDALPRNANGSMKHGVNFAGLLPIWDLLFGTFYAPLRDPEAFGADVAVPDRFWSQLAFPFRRRRVSSA